MQHGNMNHTSIGRGPASGGNENHDGDPTNKTLGEKVGQEKPAGVEEGGPDGPDVEPGPPEPETARNTKQG
jgi:hypothetical protein